jgi:hypothetical protein
LYFELSLDPFDLIGASPLELLLPEDDRFAEYPVVLPLEGDFLLQ